MASLRGQTVLLNAANLSGGTATPWAYVGAATEVSLLIDAGAATTTFTIEVAAGTGAAGMNSVLTDADFYTLQYRNGSATSTISVSGSPVALDLSPFGAQYIRVRPAGSITAGTVTVDAVATSNRSIRGQQVLWNNTSVNLNDTSAVAVIGSLTNVVLFVNSTDTFSVQVAPGGGGAGLNGLPSPSDWYNLFDETGTQVKFLSNNTQSAIDLSPFSPHYLQLTALGSGTVTAKLSASG